VVHNSENPILHMVGGLQNIGSPLNISCLVSKSDGVTIIALSSFGWYHELGIDGVVGT
jgi:hypothetical protein